MTQNDILKHVEIIRDTLERSALYRRPLAKLFIFAGCMGISASAVGLLSCIQTPWLILCYWMAIAIVTVLISVGVMIRQAQAAGEHFWGSPIQRLMHALVPPIFVGAMAGVYALVFMPDISLVSGEVIIGWHALYGCALTGASNVLLRGVRKLGWAFILYAMLLAFFFELDLEAPTLQHLAMGLGFGILHLIQGCLDLYHTRHGS